MVIRAGPQATGSGLHQGRTVPGPTCPRLRSTVGGRDLGCDHRDPARAQDQPIVQIAWKGIGNWIQGGRAPARGGRHQTLPLPGGTPASRAGGGLVTHMRLRLGFGRLVADRAKREGPSSDFTIHKDEARKQRYINRHKNGNENWNKSGIDTAGFWSRWLLWNLPTIKTSYEDIKRKFNI